MTLEEFEEIKVKFGSTEEEIATILTEIFARAGITMITDAGPQEDPEVIAAERRRLARERALRQKEKEARNPKRRIESRKKDLQENPDMMPEVPFGPYGRGPDAVSVVNITKVKAMCIPGKGVDQMLDHMVAAEATRAWMASMDKSRNFIAFNRMNLSVWSSESISSSVRERGIATSTSGRFAVIARRCWRPS